MQRIDIFGEINQSTIDNIQITDSEVELFIDSKGGYVSKGIALYNYLRSMQGVQYSATIVGECSSIAVLALLVAPLENRKAYTNAFGVVHDVRLQIRDLDISAEELQQVTDGAKREREAIIDIVSERTEQPRAIIEQLMLNETVLDFEQLKYYNYISGERVYSTNNIKNNTNMKKSILNKLADFLKNEAESIEEEVEEKEIEPTKLEDGVYTTANGSTLSIEGGAVKISENATIETIEKENCDDKDDVTVVNEDGDGDADDKEDKDEEVLEEGVGNKTEEIELLKQEIEELKKQMKSTFEVETRNTAGDKASTYSSSTVLSEVSARLDKLKK